MSEEKAPYGYCPECGEPGVHRARTPDGTTTCKTGHHVRNDRMLKKPPVFWSCYYCPHHKHKTQEEATLCGNLYEARQTIQDARAWIQGRIETTANEEDERQDLLERIGLRLHLTRRFTK